MADALQMCPKMTSPHVSFFCVGCRLQLGRLIFLVLKRISENTAIPSSKTHGAIAGGLSFKIAMQLSSLLSLSNPAAQEMSVGWQP